MRTFKELFIIICLLWWSVAMLANMFRAENFLEVVLGLVAWMVGFIVGANFLD